MTFIVFWEPRYARGALQLKEQETDIQYLKSRRSRSAKRTKVGWSSRRIADLKPCEALLSRFQGQLESFLFT